MGCGAGVWAARRGAAWARRGSRRVEWWGGFAGWLTPIRSASLRFLWVQSDTAPSHTTQYTKKYGMIVAPTWMVRHQV